MYNTGGRKLIPSDNGNSLENLVEEYLITNAEKIYIDMDDMISTLQSKSYRFSRMKRPAFANLVSHAYHAYCDANDISCDRDGSADFSFSSGNHEYDSDIEIEEATPRATMNNQLNGLYQQRNQALTRVIHSNSPRHVSQNRQDENVSSPATSSSKVPNPRRLIQINSIFDAGSGSSTASESVLNLKDDDDDDLEIIEEVTKSSTLPSGSRKQPSNSQSLTATVVVKPLESNIQNVDRERDSPKPSSGSNVALKTTQTQPQDLSTASKNMVEKIEESKVVSQKKLRGIKRKLGENEVSTSSSKNNLEDIIDKKHKREVAVQRSNYTFENFGGSEKLLEDICKLLMHLKHPEMYRSLGVTPPRGFLLHGPPGCGKTLLAQAIVGELKLPMLKMAATELISGISGESESNIRDVFEQAVNVAPCIIFLDEIDSITPKRENASKEMERRVVSQLLACIDDLITKPKGDQVLLIGATSRIETIDSALRRAGRFDREICLGIPNESAREKILRVILSGLKLEPLFNFESLAKVTPGYVGADLQALVREAAVQAVTDILITKQNSESTVTTTEIENPDLQNNLSKEVDISDPPTTLPFEIVPILPNSDSASFKSPNLPEEANLSLYKWIKETAPLSEAELDTFCIRMNNFEKALKNVQPSAKREGFATVPDTTWDDIGALKDIRDELQVSILGPVKHAAAFQALGLNAPAGVLLCGPPGCGKTLLAKAVANEAGINFISVKGPELLNMYVGESERAVRQCFQRAKNSSPCVIFFDELDSLCPRRSDGVESGSSSRVVNQLLTEMDGMESRLGVFVMGATNRPDIIDPAILRPGRLDKVLFVNLPASAERVDILKAITKNGTIPKFAEDVKLEEIGASDKCENYTGADLASLVREAGIAAFRELILEPSLRNEDVCHEKDLMVYLRHFERAFERTRPSVSQKDRDKYRRMKELHSILAVQ